MSTDSVNWQKYPENIVDESRVTFGDNHLGGCNIYGDPALELPKTWKFFVDHLNIKSVVDVGCGFGFHSKYFRDMLGCEILSVEGSSKVAELSLVPESIVCHDYTTGPYVPGKVYDLCWSVEFVEHVDAQFVENFISTFKKCKYLAMTHGLPGQGGHHHVNEQPPEYWIDLLRQHGFILDADLTRKARMISSEDKRDYLAWRSDRSPDKPYRGPAAAAHDHLGEVFLDFFFERNGLVFKNTKI